MIPHELAKVFAERIATGLRRRSVSTPSRWAENYRIMGGSLSPGLWNFTHYPWLKEMHDSKAEKNIGEKGAQLGFTELCLNLVFYKMDIENTNCLYVLPAKTPDATDFSASRFDAAVELSPHLQNLFSDVKNVGHKRAGSTNLYVRGSQSKAGLRSIPVGFLILDEVAVMNQDNIPLALERLSGQVDKQLWLISTPTLPDENIDKEFNLSTKEHFFFKCPHCSRSTELVFPECLEVIGEDPYDQRVSESFLKCKECLHKLESGRKGEQKYQFLENHHWVASYTDRDVRGFHVNQLYSPTVSPGEIALSYLRSFINPADEQEFYNSKLGLTHTVQGARVSDEDIVDCKRTHKMSDPVPQQGGPITLGIDVGKWLHYEVCQWFFPKGFTNDQPGKAICKVLDAGKVRHFINPDGTGNDDLDFLMNRYNINACVIDANPEKRMALSFANKYWGLVKLCFYGRGIDGKTITEHNPDGEPLITVDRTAWLDLSLGRFHNRTIHLPVDISLEYREHIKAPVRVYRKDKDGNPIGEYQNGSKPDHHAHARNYAELALPFAMSRGQNRNIGKVL